MMMRIPISLTLAASMLALAACGETVENDPAANTTANAAAMNDMAGNDMAATPTAAIARASISTADGTVVGDATATETPEGLRIAVSGVGMPAGTKGIHIHTVGKCDAPDFTTAGAHWNPTNRQHGMENPQGQHAGDLPNLVVAENGTASLEFTVAGATMSEGANALLDADGGAIVVHADPDDMKTDPSGESGGRIACGVFSAG
jgi:Cu-Zn family superoxide dismutase